MGTNATGQTRGERKLDKLARWLARTAPRLLPNIERGEESPSGRPQWDNVVKVAHNTPAPQGGPGKHVAWATMENHDDQGATRKLESSGPAETLMQRDPRMARWLDTSSASVNNRQLFTPEAPPGCKVKVNLTGDEPAEKVRETMRHEILHCGLEELLSPRQHDRLIEHVAANIPIQSLRDGWYLGNHAGQEIENVWKWAEDYSAQTQATAEKESARGRANLSAIRAEAYKDHYGITDVQLDLTRGEKGKTHIDPSTLGEGRALGEAVTGSVRTWVEEAITHRTSHGHDGPIVPSTPHEGKPRGEAQTTVWVEALANDVHAVYAGTLPLKEFDARYADVIGTREARPVEALAHKGADETHAQSEGTDPARGTRRIGGSAERRGTGKRATSNTAQRQGKGQTPPERGAQTLPGREQKEPARDPKGATSAQSRIEGAGRREHGEDEPGGARGETPEQGQWTPMAPEVKRVPCPEDSRAVVCIQAPMGRGKTASGDVRGKGLREALERIRKDKDQTVKALKAMDHDDGRTGDTQAAALRNRSTTRRGRGRAVLGRSNAAGAQANNDKTARSASAAAARERSPER